MRCLRKHQRALRSGNTSNLHPYCNSHLNTEDLQPAFKQEFSLGCKQSTTVHADPSSHTSCCSELLYNVTKTWYRTLLTLLNLMNCVHRTFLTVGQNVSSQKILTNREMNLNGYHLKATHIFSDIQSPSTVNGDTRVPLKGK